MPEGGAAGQATATRALRWMTATLAVVAVAQAISFAWTFASHDFIRDLLAAGDIARGEAWPLRGPVINSMVHVGPLWFYVLALPLALGGGLLAATVWAGALATLKVVAAWRLGTAIDGPRLGLLAGAFALLPGWTLIHQLQFTQTLLLELFVYATLLPLLRLWRGGTGRGWAMAGLWLGLAVQAHPAALFLLAPMALVGFRRLRQMRSEGGWIALGALLSIAPMLPMLWAEWVEGFPAAARLSAFAATPEAATRPWAAFGVLEGLTWQSARVVVDLATPLALGAPAGVLFATIGGCAALGLVGLARDPGRLSRVAAAVGLALLAAQWVSLLRPTSTYYLALAAWPFVVLSLALLVQGDGTARDGGWRASIAVTAALTLSLLGSAIVVAQGQAGRIVLPLAGMLDVVRGPAGAAPVATMPAWATEALARQTCEAHTLVLRGELAAFLDFYQGIPWRWDCTPAPRIALVDAPPTGSTVQRAIMSPAALKTMGWPTADWTTAVSIAPARVLSAGPPVLPPPPTLQHPHRDFDPAEPRDVRHVVVTHPGELLAVYAPLFIFDGGTVVAARVDGNVVLPLVATNSGAVFAAPSRLAAGNTTWTLELRGRRPEQIEIFTLRPPGAATTPED